MSPLIQLLHAPLLMTTNYLFYLFLYCRILRIFGLCCGDNVPIALPVMRTKHLVFACSKYILHLCVFIFCTSVRLVNYQLQLECG